MPNKEERLRHPPAPVIYVFLFRRAQKFPMQIDHDFRQHEKLSSDGGDDGDYEKKTNNIILSLNL